MIYHTTATRLHDDRSTLVVFAILGVLVAEGSTVLSEDSLAYPLPVPPIEVYSTKDIIIIPHESFSAIVTLSLDNRTFLLKNVSILDGCRWLTNDSESHDIQPGFILTSSAPVDVLISISGRFLQVPSINQIGQSYLFTHFSSSPDEMCEKLFIYTVKYSAELDICSDDFLQTNVSNLLDRQIINQDPSKKCVKLALSPFDGSLLGDLSGVSRLQITSSRPVGILYGLASSSVDNHSCLLNEKKEGLIDWQVLPPMSGMGKLFLILPDEENLEIHLTIIGPERTVVGIKTSQNQTFFCLSTVKPLYTSVITDNTAIIIQSNASILTYIRYAGLNTSSTYFAQPIQVLNNDSCKREVLSEVAVCSKVRNLSLICMDNITLMSIDGIQITPVRINTLRTLDNQTLYIMDISESNHTVLRYPCCACTAIIHHTGLTDLILQNHCRNARVNSVIRNVSRTFQLYNKIENSESVLNGNKTVINLISVLRKVQSTQNSNGKQFDFTNTDESFYNKRTQLSHGLLNGSVTLNSTRNLITSTLSSIRKDVTTQGKTGNSLHISKDKQRDLNSNLFNRSNHLNYTTETFPAQGVTHLFPFLKETAKAVNIQNASNALKLPLKNNGIKYPTQMREPSRQEADVNNAFNMVLDIIHSEDGEVLNTVGSSQNTGDNQFGDVVFNRDSLSHNVNPPYVIDTDMFFKLESDLDGKNSMAVIISLGAALAAVFIVILIFFLVEVFSRRKYIRNTRIRPSVSFY